MTLAKYVESFEKKCSNEICSNQICSDGIGIKHVLGGHNWRKCLEAFIKF